MTGPSTSVISSANIRGFGETELTVSHATSHQVLIETVEKASAWLWPVILTPRSNSFSTERWLEKCSIKKRQPYQRKPVLIKTVIPIKHDLFHAYHKNHTSHWRIILDILGRIKLHHGNRRNRTQSGFIISSVDVQYSPCNPGSEILIQVIPKKHTLKGLSHGLCV